ncbi:MAG: hypothetical protein ACTTHG_05245 [Treponemataceae bacterium]
MLSFIKFLNYLNENPDDLADNQKDSLHTLLFCNTHDRFITPQLISKKLCIRKSFAKEIFVSLAKNTDLNVKIKCSNCNCDNDFSSSSCKECGELLEITEDNLFAKIEGILPDKRKLYDNEESLREKQLSQMITIWDKQKFIVYMLIDVSNSEMIQNKNNENYKKYLDCLRDAVKQSLSILGGNYLCFGEIGDCFKLGFSDINDVRVFLEEIAKIHYGNFKSNHYPPAIEGLKPYPCLKISAQLLELGNSQNPKNLLFKTLNGALDFNSDLLTKLFRLDGAIKLNYDTVFNENNKICAFIFDQLADKMGLKGEKQTIEAGKHIPHKADVIAITFSKGELKISDNPKRFLRNE